MKKMIWVVGSPRSGTTFLTDYLGQFADKTYNEPWGSHPIERPRSWKFPPDAQTIVFKYCENWRNLHVLTHRWPESYFVHVWRDPDNVVHSMASPKRDSKPHRNLYGGLQGEDRVRMCMQRWLSNSVHCLSIYNILPSRYYEVRYEDMLPGLKKLDEAASLGLSLDKLDFSSRNLTPDLDWALNPAAKKLRDLVLQHEGEGTLAELVNKKRPKMLQRVVL